MIKPERRIPHGAAPAGDLLGREWLLTNGLGGYASGTIGGVNTRRYHGLLIAALPVPLGRMVMLNHLAEEVQLQNGSCIHFSGETEHAGPTEATDIPCHFGLKEFRLEMGLPVWRYEGEGFVLEKRLVLPYRQNTVMIHYRLLQGSSSVFLTLRPSLHFRPHEEPVNQPLESPYTLSMTGDRYEIFGPSESLRLRMKLHAQRTTLTIEEDFRQEIYYSEEAHRGYESYGCLWSPGFFRTELSVDRPASFVASTEPWTVMLCLDAEESLQFEEERRRRLLMAAEGKVSDGFTQELILAADQFLITPTTRPEEAVRAAARGDEVGTIIAGYHWFTDWGRDTMISLEGLTLTTGRFREAGCILRTFAHYIRDGLIPNLFPEGRSQGLYHTADATLWLFHALDRYYQYTGDRLTLLMVLPKLIEIIRHHSIGTRFGIRLDPSDGLLIQGQEGYQLTWMDAKVGDWVVTPRRGKAVEINALWYNALRLLEEWLREEGETDEAAKIGGMADKTRESFNRRFWNPDRNFLFDVVNGERDGNDPVCRPNQLLAISLKYPVLEQAHWDAVLTAAQEKLLTPVGLRSLEPGAADYKVVYFGDIHARDAAYHQGTVWAWLIGPFIDAWMRVHPDDPAGARRFLEGFEKHFGEAGIGSISEIFDAENPFIPRGCIAQAWSVAEVLRCLVKTGK